MSGDNARAAMFTVCPKCALTLVVTAADLRVAQGYVRCGRCSSVFNALARLSDERQAALSAGEPAAAPAPEPETPAQEERADISPLDEALARSEESETPESPTTDEEPFSEDALEFDPETTDVNSVFVKPPPNPQWTAATGSFKAKRAASEEPTTGEATPGAPGDSQVDVEIDGAFLAEILREPAPADSAHPTAGPPPAELPRSAASRAPPPQQRAPPPRAGPAPAPAPPPRAPPASVPPATRAPPDSAPERGTAEADAAADRAAPAGSPRAAARHVPAHTRPPAEASTRSRSGAAREAEPPAREAQALQPTAEPMAAALDLDPEETTVPRGAAARFRIPWVHSQLWSAGAALALVLLAAQVVNHYRDELAASSRFGRPLTALYASLGVQLVPHWDLRAYDVRQLGASADPAGSGIITVRASIKNAGPQPQPLPLLRVTLQDRFGNRIAARDVAPRFYVPRSVPETSSLAGGQRIDAEMGFLDPGANAVGFEIDACLPSSGGGITCANDLATR
jgi:predicted Zn finger-like uncharacterized protein